MKELTINNPDELGQYINAMLKDVNLETDEAVNQAIEKVAKQAVSQLKANSPKGTGKYKRGWKYKIEKVRADGSFSVTIYNAKRGNITHLIEHGHPIVSKGTVVGHAKAQPHISPVNDWVQSGGFDMIAQAVEKAINSIKT